MSRQPNLLNLCLSLSLLTAVNCASDTGGSNGNSTELGGNENQGGYTGLGQYTGVAGVYGNGEVGVGGTSSLSGTNTSIGTVAASSGGTQASSGGTQNGTTATGGTATGGTSTSVWPGSYNPTGTALEASGHHSPGANCMSSACHAASQTNRAFAFGGTLYLTGGTSPAANVQIAIVSGANVYSTYSGANGNFWLPLASASNIDWANTKVYLRNKTGELTKPASASVAAGCNSCHDATNRIVGP